MQHTPRTFGRPEPRFDCELPATPRSLARLRARFAGWLDAIGVADFVRRDLLLTVSELADRGGVIDARARGLDAIPAGRGLAIVASVVDVLTVRDIDTGRGLRARIGWENLASQPVSR